jgi:hypothetical protein
MIKKIGKVAEALSTNRSGAIRFLMKRAGLWPSDPGSPAG